MHAQQRRVIGLKPPLVIGEGEARIAVGILDAALEEFRVVAARATNRAIVGNE